MHRTLENGKVEGTEADFHALVIGRLGKWHLFYKYLLQVYSGFSVCKVQPGDRCLPFRSLQSGEVEKEHVPRGAEKVEDCEGPEKNLEVLRSQKAYRRGGNRGWALKMFCGYEERPLRAG